MKKVLSVENMREVERKIMQAESINEFTLMQKAVCGILTNVKLGVKTLVVCGCGNNGGDGLGVAYNLQKMGENVEVLLVCEKVSPSAKAYLDEYLSLNGKVYYFENNFDFTNYQQIIDCIFGIGFHGQVSGIYKEVINGINNSSAFVLSVDIASGINGNSGLGETKVKSDLTVSVGALKYGNVLNMAKDCQKNLTCCEIGKVDDYGVNLFEVSDCKQFLRDRDNFSHKGNYGYVAIMGGCESYVGAPKLSLLALSSLKSGAGVSTVIAPSCIKNAILNSTTVTTFFEMPSKDGYILFDKQKIDNAIKKLSVLAVGMGMGQSDQVDLTIEYILQNYTKKLIIDADGLNALSRLDKNLLKYAKCEILITPHILEMSRLTGIPSSEIIANPIKVATSFAKEYGVTVLLKGTCTVVTDGEKTILVNAGASGMATAGSGDALSGVLAGVLGWNNLDINSVAFSVYLCGIAGEIASSEFGDISMTSLDAVNCIYKAIKRIKSQI